MENESNSPEPTDAASDSLPAAPVLSEVEGSEQQLEDVIHLLRSDPQALAQVVSQMCPDEVRRDGWTPFARRLFLQVLGETGRVSLACEYAQLSKQSAYALRARDPVFAAGWDAACEIARAPLADALYERAVEGVTDTITRNGEVVAERHRHDSRLSVAVLHRLDKRCDRAAEAGARHLALVARWDDWLRLVGKGEDEAAQALLETPLLETPLLQNSSHGQLGQLPLGENPADEQAEEDESESLDLSDRCWRHPDKLWLTSFPPPAGFTGYENRPYDEDQDVEPYERECTAQETAILDADTARAAAAERAEHEALRDSWFELLSEDVAAWRAAGPDPAESGSAPGVGRAAASVGLPT